MTMDDERYFKDFYQALQSRPLEPHDPLYVQIFERRDLSTADPVDALRRGIEWGGPETVQPFSGFRGTGKSTELARLDDLLVRGGHLVIRCDMEDYVNLTMPVDISDFLIAVAGAFGEALKADHLLGKDTSRPSYWERFIGSWKTKIAIENLQVASVKAALKTDPIFKTRIQEQLRGHLAALVSDVRAYMADGVKALRKRRGEDKNVVMILDSMEHLRGTSLNAEDVHASLENLFVGHADKLRFQSMHVVYTVPPWLKIRAPGVEGSFDGGELIPCVKVLDPKKDTPYPPGIDALTEIVARRGDWKRLLGTQEHLERLILASGGYLRDLFRLLQTTLRLAPQHDKLPVDDALVNLAIADLRNDYLPIARQDAIWLHRVATTHQAELESREALKELARFFDTHVVLCYRNGEEWFDVHPQIRAHIKELAEDAGSPSATAHADAPPEA